MKVSLVVAAGAHEGRVIPITGPQFLIGRDQQCHLRPASQAISKLHCAISVRDGTVYLKDFGSTNGTLVNDGIVQGAEIAIEDGTSVRVGPLDFKVKIEKAAKDGTPLPAESPETAAALAAVKAAAAAKAPPRDTTPNPAKKPAGIAPQPASNPGTPKPNPAAAKTPIPSVLAAPKPGSKEAAAPKSGDSTPGMNTSESVTSDDQERIAAMLLGMDDDGNGSVPDGSTVMDIPSPLAGTTEGGEGAKPDEKKDDKPKKAQTREEMSSAANDLLRKYMRRPK